jgi:predicted LPLAT superfamily acyltransferase
MIKIHTFEEFQEHMEIKRNMKSKEIDGISVIYQGNYERYGKYKPIKVQHDTDYKKWQDPEYKECVFHTMYTAYLKIVAWEKKND